MPISINLYKNTAEPNRLDKTNFLTLVDSLNGEFREENSITSLSITIEYNKVPDFNYVYIPIFNRYYYVDDVVSVRNNLWEIILSVDVLMSFKDAILNCDGFVERNEGEYNNELIDKKRVIEQGYNIDRVVITNNLFDPNSKGDFVLEGLGLGSVVGDLYSITTNLTNVIAGENNPTYMGSNDQIYLSFRVGQGYVFPSQTDTSNFSVTNATIVSWTIGIYGGATLSLANATGNVNVTIKGVAV